MPINCLTLHYWLSLSYDCGCVMIGQNLKTKAEHFELVSGVHAGSH